MLSLLELVFAMSRFWALDKPVAGPYLFEEAVPWFALMLLYPPVASHFIPKYMLIS